MLRGVEKLEIGTADIDDLSRYPDNTHTNNPIQPHDLDLDLVSEFKSLAEGNAPIAYVFKMYGRLLSYAQTFERNPTFREEMDAPYGDTRARFNPKNRGQFLDYHYRGGRSIFKSYHKTGGEHHPVEHYLEVASAASESNNVEEFLKAQREVLDYLER
jgi:hypothetical protein